MCFDSFFPTLLPSTVLELDRAAKLESCKKGKNHLTYKKGMFSNEIYGYASLSIHATEMGAPAFFFPPPPLHFFPSFNHRLHDWQNSCQVIWVISFNCRNKKTHWNWSGKKHPGITTHNINSCYQKEGDLSHAKVYCFISQWNIPDSVLLIIPGCSFLLPLLNPRTKPPDFFWGLTQ